MPNYLIYYIQTYRCKVWECFCHPFYSLVSQMHTSLHTNISQSLGKHIILMDVFDCTEEHVRQLVHSCQVNPGDHSTGHGKQILVKVIKALELIESYNQSNQTPTWTFFLKLTNEMWQNYFLISNIFIKCCYVQRVHSKCPSAIWLW